MTAPEIAAVVVLYRPTPDVLANVASYAHQVAAVIAVDNSESPEVALVDELERRGVRYRWLGENRGIATALNDGCREARRMGFEWAITFDQDSTGTDGMIAQLVGCVATGCPGAERVAVVAPLCQQVGGAPVKTHRGCRDIEVAMTSGSLTRLAALESLGGFRDDFFIDRVDVEFCLRARRRGWRILQCGQALLLYRMGKLRKVAFPAPFYVSDYPPLRRYYMVRNLLAVRREYGRDYPAVIAAERRYWSRELVKIMVAERRRRSKVAMMACGWRDYRAGRFGKYEDLHPKRRGGE